MWLEPQKEWEQSESMNRKTIRLILGVIAVAALLAGCQGGKAEKREETKTQAEDDSEKADKDFKNDPEDTEDSAKTEIPRKMTFEEAKSRAESLMDDISIWEYEYLYVLAEENEGYIDFREDAFERTRAAALSTTISEEDEAMLETQEEASYALADSDVTDSARNFFGKAPDFESLKEDDPFIIRVDENGSSHAVRLISFYEDEGMFEINDWSLAEEDNGYRLDQQLYCGYWGWYNGNNSNYEVSFHLEESPVSKYGLVITDMRYKKTVEDAWDNLPDADYSAFYGVWCAAVKDEAEAQVIADKISEAGFDGRVFCTDEWSNMNSDRWYAVTAGVFYSEDAAESALKDVKALGYKDAYVKYSGDYHGNN